ncbi:MAG TPA: glycoside hydrolase family 3 C-terminal domain-containing protein [Bacteroidota bacterium]|nr:glycoside hydrolase family 3 C-terminal domain-containing protein [Bacteroidota bacterium]
MTFKISGFLYVVLSIVVMMGSASAGENTKKPIYLDTAYSFKERAADLVSRMTPEEKQSQLGNTMPPIPRLGINKYDVWGEALHGVLGRNNNSGMTATSFPNSVAVGCSWDPDLLRRESSVIADEARGFNHDIIFTLTYWSPVVEPARDPRWGRTAETYGEDPFLVSRIAGGFIQGLMGDDPRYLEAVPCGKHYFANNSEFNRHTGSANMDDRDMREYYLLPYRTLIEKDKLPAIMTAYSAVNGIPVSASPFLVDTIAKRIYGLDGYVTGDCGAISDIVSGHHYAKNDAEAVAMGLHAGVDNDCGGVYQTHALEALNQGLITEGDIDKALVDIYTIRMRLGEFDPRTMVPYAGITPGTINAPSHNDLAVEIATKTPVLLKNTHVATTGRKALPLNAQTIKKIAVLGPQADKVELGDYSGEAEQKYKITPLAGIRNYVAENKLSTEIVSRSGGNTERRTDFFSMIRFSTVGKSGTVRDYDATKFNASANGLIASARFGLAAVRGIKDGDWTSYDNIDITDLDSMRFTMTVSGDGGTLEVRVGSSTGNILASEKIAGTPQSGGFPGFARPRTVSAKIQTLGITGPQTIVLVYHAPEIPPTDQETLEMAKSSDVAVIFVGTDQTTGREESDRFSLGLPGNQYELIKSVAAVNPNTIVVIQGMGMVEVDQLKDNPNVAGMIFTGYNGQGQGTAIAKILFGEVNPGGKTNVTWYKSLRDLPDLTDYSLRGGAGKNGRTYMYFNNEVSYEFGFGLSYTTFEYSNFRISKRRITPNDKVTITADVKNTGSVDGDEVVQVYVATPGSPASLERPAKRLRGFQRVTIPRGQTKTVSIDIDCADLWFFDAASKKITFDPGKYVFEIGASSKDIRGTVGATMSGAYTPALETVVADCDKVVLRPGNTAQTRVTASLSDDSFVNLSDAKISYRSDNPSVAAVDEKGKVTATGVGVASIAADVTVNGKTVSGSYPLKVMPDLSPASVTVDGKPIEGFRKEVKAYSYLLESGSAIPTVKASAASRDIGVEVTQAHGVPGTAVIDFVDNVTLEKNRYYLNFDAHSTNDEFNGPSVGKQWEWVRENRATYSLSKNPGSLSIVSEPGDVSEGSNNARNLLLQSANNDWTIVTKLVCSRIPSQPENAGILAYENDDNFVKLMLRAVTKTNQPGRMPGSAQPPGTIDLIIEENGIAKSMAAVDIRQAATGDNALVLKLEKHGTTYTAYYSWDGVKFDKLGTADLLLKDIKAGLIVCDGVILQGMKSIFWFNPDTTKPGTPFEVAFDYFHITNSGLK